MARPRAGIKSLTFLTDTSDTGSRFLLLPLHSSSHGWLQGRAPWTQNVPGFRRKEFSLLHGLFWAWYLMKYKNQKIPSSQRDWKLQLVMTLTILNSCGWGQAQAMMWSRNRRPASLDQRLQSVKSINVSKRERKKGSEPRRWGVPGTYHRSPAQTHTCGACSCQQQQSFYPQMLCPFFGREKIITLVIVENVDDW